MSAERVWAAVWVTFFLPALVGLCGVFLPNIPAVQVAVVPSWVVWWVLTTGPRLRVWVAVWGGALLEWAWGVPPGACVIPFLAVWSLTALFKESLPEKIKPIHGAWWGAPAAPAMLIWLWLYSILWMGPEGALPLRPTFGTFLAIGTGIGGGWLTFLVARACDFRVLTPPKTEAHGDAG